MSPLRNWKVPQKRGTVRRSPPEAPAQEAHACLSRGFQASCELTCGGHTYTALLTPLWGFFHHRGLPVQTAVGQKWEVTVASPTSLVLVHVSGKPSVPQMGSIPTPLPPPDPVGSLAKGVPSPDQSSFRGWSCWSHTEPPDSTL